jgi:hypothetical protein
MALRLDPVLEAACIKDRMLSHCVAHRLHADAARVALSATLAAAPQDTAVDGP